MLAPVMTEVDLHEDDGNRNYTLQGLFSPGFKLSFNPKLGILSLLYNNSIRHQCRLTEREAYIFLAILECYPHYTPYEYVLAALKCLVISPEAIEECRGVYLEAAQNGNLNTLLSDVRTIICRLRKPLQGFGLNIASITATGYMLQPTQPPLPSLAGQPASDGRSWQRTPVPISRVTGAMHSRL